MTVIEQNPPRGFQRLIEVFPIALLDLQNDVALKIAQAVKGVGKGNRAPARRQVQVGFSIRQTIAFIIHADIEFAEIVVDM